MINIKTLIICIGLLSFSGFLKAQSYTHSAEEKHISETSKMYEYRFTGKLAAMEIEQLREAILKMDFVKEAKVVYKSEKNAGQVRLVTLEKFTSTDMPFQFSILGLKELLISKNLFPEEYSSELISEK